MKREEKKNVSWDQTLNTHIIKSREEGLKSGTERRWPMRLATGKPEAAQPRKENLVQQSSHFIGPSEISFHLRGLKCSKHCYHRVTAGFH